MEQRKMELIRNKNTIINMISKYNQEYFFYSKYHKNKVNQILHILGIPMIVWSVFLVTHKYKFMYSRLSTILYFIYMTYYVNINKNIGYLAGFYYYFVYKHSDYIYKNYNKSKVLKYALYAQILAWFMQFYGHKFHEKNRPALFTSFIQSFTMAPLFAIDHLNKFIDKLI